MSSIERAGAQSPPISEQKPSQGREAPSKGQMHPEHHDDSKQQHQSGEVKNPNQSVLDNLPSNPKDGGPLEKYVQAKTGTKIE